MAPTQPDLFAAFHQTRMPKTLKVERIYSGPVSTPAFDRAERDEAMALVETAAERARERFKEDATVFVCEYLAQYGAASGECLTLACKRAGIVPHDDRAFGPVYMSLARARLIEKVGKAPRMRGHGTSGGNIWALCRVVL